MENTKPRKANQLQRTDGKPKQPKPKGVSSLQRILLLISLIFWTAGFWGICDFPQTLGDYLIEEFGITQADIGILYSLASSFTIVVSPASGLLITKYGAANIGLLSVSFTTVGSFILYLAVKLNSFPVLILGRTIYLLGAEPLLISQATSSEKWFSGRLLSISMGLNMSFGMAAASLCNYIAPLLIVEYRNLEAAFFFYVCLSTASLTFVAIYNYLDWKNQPLLDNEKREEMKKGQKSTKTIETEKNLLQDEKGELLLKHEEDGNENNKKDDQLDSINFDYTFKLKDLFKMGPVYWCVVMLYTIASNAYYMLTRIIRNTAVHRFGYDFLRAKNFLSTIQILSAIFLPFNSVIITKLGKKLKVILFALTLLFISYTTMVLSPKTPSLSFQIAVYLTAMFYIFYQSTIYPCVAMSVPKDAVSIGYGVAGLIQGIALAGLPVVLGYITKQETATQFQHALYLLLTMVVISLAIVLVGIVSDKRAGGLLDKPENSKEAKIAKNKLDRKFRDYLVKRDQKRGNKGSFVSVETIGAMSSVDPLRRKEEGQAHAENTQEDDLG